MGKRRKTGARHRDRTVAKRMLSRESLCVQSAQCCHCDEWILTANIKGTWGNRRCPSCGGVLNAEAFEERFQPALDEFRICKSEIEEGKKQHSDLEKKIHRFRSFIFAPYRFWLQRKLDKNADKMSDVCDKKKKLSRVLNNAALSRYYTSEWFLATNIALKGISPQGDKYSLRPSVCDAGQLSLRPDGSYAAGIVGEFDLFESLHSIVKESSGALMGARIIPNLYLPNPKWDVRAKSDWSQIDCIMLTTKCAIIFETKRWNKHIKADMNALRIASALTQDSLEEEDAWMDERKNPFSQNSKHVNSFRNHTNHYAPSKVFEFLVFDKPRSFLRYGENANKNVYACSIPQDINELAHALEDFCMQGEEVVTQQEVDELADHLLLLYGDLGQCVGDAHARMLSK